MTEKSTDAAAAQASKDAEAKAAPAPTKAEAKPKAAAKPKGKTEAGSITVVGPKAGFWRAGIRFSATPQVFAPGSLSAAQLKAIKDEPKLAVTTTE